MSNENVDKGADSSPKVSKIESDLPLYFAKTLAGMEQLAGVGVGGSRRHCCEGCSTRR
jgi:hypothetical protein